MTNYRADYLTPEALSRMPFKSLGDDVMIHERVTLVGIENISIGSHVRIDPEVILLATGPLTIGCYTHIATGVFIAAKAGFEMKNFTNIAHGSRIYTVNDDYSGEYLMGPTIPADLLNLNEGAILMEEQSGLGAGAIVLPGVTLAEGSMLGRAEPTRQIHRALDDVWRCAGKAHQETAPRRSQQRSEAFGVKQIHAKEHSIVLTKGGREEAFVVTAKEFPPLNTVSTK